MGENTDIDLESMSQEDLEKFISSEGQPSEEVPTQEPEQEIQDDTIQDPEPEQEEVTEEVIEEPEQGEPEEDELPELYRGKTAKDLVKMIEEQKKYESRRGVEIGQLRSEISSLRSNVDKKLESFEPSTKAEKKDFVDELISEYGYDKKDVDVITKLVEHKAKQIISQQEQEKEAQKQAKAQEISKSNQSLWDNIKDFYDNADEIEDAMIEAIRKDTQNTLHRPGWVKSFVKGFSNKQPEPVKTTTQPQVNGAKKRLARTQTAKAASRPTGSTPTRSDLDSKDPQVYRRAWNYFNPNNQM